MRFKPSSTPMIRDLPWMQWGGKLYTVRWTAFSSEFSESQISSVKWLARCPTLSHGRRICRRVLLLQYLVSSWPCSQDSSGKYPLVAISISRFGFPILPLLPPVRPSGLSLALRPSVSIFLRKATMDMQTILS
ncbi:hypothetical protein K456DRAFT_1334642 [Colletotrichum gloeosporioides 23]|nr:hypothetical protein K456DRAFT_1334642 [Colletotrichum gloeosporioides 23]